MSAIIQHELARVRHAERLGQAEQNYAHAAALRAGAARAGLRPRVLARVGQFCIALGAWLAGPHAAQLSGRPASLRAALALEQATPPRLTPAAAVASVRPRRPSPPPNC